MKPSDHILDMIADVQDLSVEAEINGDIHMQKMADWSIPQLFKYAAFFKCLRL